MRRVFGPVKYLGDMPKIGYLATRESSELDHGDRQAIDSIRHKRIL